jgi:GT2 family glycosyltransferase
MTPDGGAPVALFVFNRPHCTERAMDVLRAVRPSTLLVVADGPRGTHPDDRPRCDAVRALTTTVDWPCEIVTEWSDRNLGCDARLQTGLDWVFSQVDRAIVVEDDVIAHPSFFGWCSGLLDRYADDGDISMVSGCNPLGRWGPPGAHHLIARRGSIHGWATWRRAWAGADHSLRTAADPDLDARIAALDLDPMVAQYLASLAHLAAMGTLTAWDTRWNVTQHLAGQWAAVSPVNLVHNIGFGDDATRTTNARDYRADTPTFPAPDAPEWADRPPPDPDFDRASLVVDLLATQRRPEMALRLAKMPHLLRRPDGTPDEHAMVHLAPLMDRARLDLPAPAPSRCRLAQHHPGPPAVRAGGSRPDTVEVDRMTTGPTVGVVMPVRNNVATVEDALRSVTTQVPPPDDVVVVDGASTDGTVSIVRGVAGVRLVAQDGRGLGRARNQGIATLTTDLVAFLDGDDRWTPDSLACRVRHLVAHPDGDAVTGQHLEVDLDAAPDTATDNATDAAPEREPHDAPHQVRDRSVTPRPALTPGGLLVRRAALHRVGPFAEHLTIGSDSDWFVRLRQSGLRFDVLDDVVLVKGRRSTSLSTDVTTYRNELLGVARDFLRRQRPAT